MSTYLYTCKYAHIERVWSHTDQYCIFDSDHLLEHKMSVIKTIQLKANEIATTTQGKKKGQENLKTALQTGPVLWTDMCLKSRG